MGPTGLRRAAWLLGAGRAALGVAVLAAPVEVTGRWLGAENAALPAVQDLARGLGARDLALGLGVLWTLDDRRLGPRMQAAAAFSDLVDVAATVIARRHLPRVGVLGTAAVAGAAAAAGFHISNRLARAQ